MPLFSQLHPDWQVHLADLKIHIDRIESDLSSLDFQPAHKQIFRALALPVSDTKVLIVGQDPYPNPDFPSGLAFSVNPGARQIPGSLRNILKEVVSDVGASQIQNGDLTPWHEQGVMLLNRVLTVSPGESGSHTKIGWQVVTERVAEVLGQRDVVAILWGKYAQELSAHFPQSHLITGVHPSPLSAHRGFFGSRPFSAANTILRDQGREAIIW